MTTDNGITSVESMKSPIGKVIGVVETRAQFQAVSEALAKLGVQEVEVLEGANGINHLEDDQAAVAQCFLGDYGSRNGQTLPRCGQSGADRFRGHC